MKSSSVFKVDIPPNDAIVQLADKLFDSFENEQFTLGVFIPCQRYLIQLIISSY